MRKMFALFLLFAVVGGTAAMADALKKGDKELTFAFTYTDQKIKPENGDDLSLTNINLGGAFGYCITRGNEVGISGAYQKTEVTDVDTVSGTVLGFFYNYNFQAGEMMNPFLGANYQFYSGDLGDVWRTSYGINGGIKVYPWANAGMQFGMRYDWYVKNTGFENSDGWAFFAAIGLKF